MHLQRVGDCEAHQITSCRKMQDLEKRAASEMRDLESGKVPEGAPRIPGLAIHE